MRHFSTLCVFSTFILCLEALIDNCIESTNPFGECGACESQVGLRLTFVPANFNFIHLQIFFSSDCSEAFLCTSEIHDSITYDGCLQVLNRWITMRCRNG